MDYFFRYVMSTQNEKELHDHLNTLLDFDNPQHKNFFLELSRRKFPPKGVLMNSKIDVILI